MTPRYNVLKNTYELIKRYEVAKKSSFIHYKIRISILYKKKTHS